MPISLGAPCPYRSLLADRGSYFLPWGVCACPKAAVLETVAVMVDTSPVSSSLIFLFQRQILKRTFSNTVRMADSSLKNLPLAISKRLSAFYGRDAAETSVAGPDARANCLFGQRLPCGPWRRVLYEAIQLPRLWQPVFPLPPRSLD